MRIICDVICTAIDIGFFYMSMKAMSHIYSTSDIANVEGTQVHCSNRCHIAILIGRKTPVFNGTYVIACQTVLAMILQVAFLSCTATLTVMTNFMHNES